MTKSNLNAVRRPGGVIVLTHTLVNLFLHLRKTVIA